MSLTAGTRLGAYEVVAPLGAGGMGEVYRAQDTKLGRAVAVKVLPDQLAADQERIARFEREAKVLAALNHPHIAALYGMDQCESRHFLVMELVEGETLAERIGRGPMTPEDALETARQIAEALEAAHESGIVHRDLKPANVKITPEGRVKVLDFGLAKALEVAPAASNPTFSPTLSLPATQAGLILGTAAYMSPEQAKGLPADQRSDVFSFGVVLCEMLTGRQPFRGDSVPDVLASVLAREPELGGLPPDLNPRLPELIQRCLEKNPRRRWQAVGDLRAEIETIAASPRTTPAAVQAAGPHRPLWKRSLPVIAAAIAAAVLAGVTVWNFRPEPRPAVTRFTVPLRQGDAFTGTSGRMVAISPAGTEIAYVANQRLYARSMAELGARPISGAEATGIYAPVFSPDGRSIAFWTTTDRTIKRIAASGGAAVTICPAELGSAFEMTWEGESILFSGGDGGIRRVPANGGKPEVLVKAANGETAYAPQILPGGQTILFTVTTGSGRDRGAKASIVAQSIKSGERKTLIEQGAHCRYLPTGHLVYASGGVLFAVPFDLKRMTPSGGPTPVVEGVRRGFGLAVANFSVSETGTLVYIPGAADSEHLQLAFFDRDGRPEPLKVPPGPYELPRLSPDGKNIAFGTDDGKEATVSVYDLSGKSSVRRLTFGGRNRYPVWSADGTRVAFQSDREGDLAIFWQRADGTGTAERLTRPDPGTSHIPQSWARDGERLLFDVTRGNSISLWTFSLRDRKAAPLDAVESTVSSGGVLSPDGRWVAYTSLPQGRPPAVYVQPFPPTGAKYQISTDSEFGHHPLWSADGHELFYTPGPGPRLFAVSISLSPSFSFGAAAAIARPFTNAPPQLERTFDIARDGKRFLGLSAAGEAGSAPQVHVVLNWFEELKQRVPVR